MVDDGHLHIYREENWYSYEKVLTFGQQLI